jgi:hypothetical protein
MVSHCINKTDTTSRFSDVSSHAALTEKTNFAHRVYIYIYKITKFSYFVQFQELSGFYHLSSSNAIRELPRSIVLCFKFLNSIQTPSFLGLFRRVLAPLAAGLNIRLPVTP